MPRLLLALLVAATVASSAAAEPAGAISVSYISSSAVYLDSGRAEGLATGARLRVVRAGEAIAELEVDFVAEHSASCRVVTSRQAIVAGDRVEIVSLPATEAPEPNLVSSAPETETFSPVSRPALRPIAMKPWARSVGSLTVGFRTFSDDLGPSIDETTGRLSLRLSEIGGKPLQLRARLRSRETRRDGFGPSVAKSQSSDRLYELSLRYAPPAGRFRFELGRLGAGAYDALGYLDGALGELRLGQHFSFGLFAGSRPDLTDLGFQTAGQKYGTFIRLATAGEPGQAYAELVTGAVVENAEGGETSREYVTLESRFGKGTRWWLLQRAEIDLHRGWRRETAGDSSQITNAALAAAFQLSPSVRASLSYDQNRNFLTYESRPRPEEIFQRYFRSGERLSIDWHRPSGWAGSIGAGSEQGDDVEESTRSGSFSLLHSRSFGAPLLLGIDGSFYSGGAAEGWVGNLRTRWSFSGGHDLGLTVGASEATLSALPDLPRASQWARLSGNIQLPMRLFLYGEYERIQGDDFDGDRALVELGYRF